ncbi:hypothetical protein GCM10027275_29290 [Rhabdobacter roseus]
MSTKYVEGGNREQLRSIAFSELYSHFQSSTKEKSFYEVISGKNGRFIVNYNRIEQRLTLCTDPGSGWAEQFKDISEADLGEFVSKGVELNDFDGTNGNMVWVDSVTYLVRGVEFKKASSAEWIRPKTNGSPSLEGYRLVN